MRRKCSKRWILERAHVCEILRLTEEDGLSREEAEIIVFTPTGMLAGPWDKHKSYPDLNTASERTPLATLSVARAPTNACTVPVVEVLSMRRTSRKAHKSLDWPEVDATRAQDARNAFLEACDEYHKMNPMTNEQIVRAYDDLMQSLYESYQTHGEHDSRYRPQAGRGTSVHRKLDYKAV
ncbi:hypothetical protein PHBOTO_001193 [Pseudozyma hubeiensis]|nr:hypothetical protein PHBOTO_001193 [Pseudozyma hubeiensis]